MSARPATTAMNTVPVRLNLLVIAICGLASTGCAQPARVPLVSSAPTAEAAGMVSIRALVPDIHLDIRYAGSMNFVGVPITGYEAPRCYLLRPVAEALQRVEMALREQSLRLQIFDCYRPVRAVQHFMKWVGDPADQRTKADYYPNLTKSQLPGVYIARVSGHSRGATLDLTLMQCDGNRCAALDMGTDFDFLDVRAHTDAADVTPLQRENRQRLRAAMEGGGFQNYALEWWHYSFKPEPSPDMAYDFPVR